MSELLPIQVFEAGTGQRLEELRLDWIPHPGHRLMVGEQSYTILEKRHSYCLRDGRYCLFAIRVFVQLSPLEASDASPGSIGDTSCRYNARSPLLRCAVHPTGPCEACPSYLPYEPTLSAH